RDVLQGIPFAGDVSGTPREARESARYRSRRQCPLRDRADHFHRLGPTLVTLAEDDVVSLLGVQAAWKHYLIGSRAISTRWIARKLSRDWAESPSRDPSAAGMNRRDRRKRCSYSRPTGPGRPPPVRPCRTQIRRTSRPRSLRGWAITPERRR